MTAEQTRRAHEVLKVARELQRDHVAYARKLCEDSEEYVSVMAECFTAREVEQSAEFILGDRKAWLCLPRTKEPEPITKGAKHG